MSDQGHLWVLNGSEDALATSDQTEVGDVVLRSTDDAAEVGEITASGTVAWWGEIDADLLPGVAEVDRAEQRDTPLQRVDRSPELRTAVDGLRSAFRERGG